MASTFNVAAEISNKPFYQLYYDYSIILKFGFFDLIMSSKCVSIEIEKSDKVTDVADRITSNSLHSKLQKMKLINLL